MGRQEDESTGYVLPNHMLFQIAENMPKDQEGVIACCNPVPPLVNQHVSDIVRMIAEGRFYEGNPEVVSNACDEFEDIQREISPENTGARFNSTSYDDTRSGFEVYEITGPEIQDREPLLTLFTDDSSTNGESIESENYHWYRIEQT